MKPADGGWVTEKPAGLPTWSEECGVECRPQRVTRRCEDAGNPCTLWGALQYMGYIYITTIISLFFLRVTRENIPGGQHRNAQGAVSPVETQTRTHRWGPAGQATLRGPSAGQ